MLQQNDLAESKNRTLTNMVNAMILNAKLPMNLWGEALHVACHMHNRILSRKYKVSPYKLWRGRQLNLNYIRVWGCVAYYRVPNPKRSKLGPRAIKSVFVGYAENSKACRLLDLDANVIGESRGVKIFENKFINDSIMIMNKFWFKVQVILIHLRLLNQKRQSVEIMNEPRRSQRVRKKNLLVLTLSLQMTFYS